MTIGSISFDHPDPSIFTVLTSPLGHARHGQLRLRDLPAALAGGGGHLPPALVPPQPDERVHGPGATAQYDAKPGGFKPGGASLHNCMVPHGPDAEAFEKASARRRSRRRSSTTRWPSCSRAAGASSRPSSRCAGGALDRDYADCWAGLEDRFEAMNDSSTRPTTRSCAAGSPRPTRPACDFPIQNLPFGRFRPCRQRASAWRIGVAIGDQVLDLRLAAEQCPWDGDVQRLLAAAGARAI